MEISRTSFLVFITFSGIYIFIMLLLCLQVSHFVNECEHSRSEGKPKKFCYHETLYCDQNDLFKWKFEATESDISFRNTSQEETISFGNYLKIGICYGACPPSSTTGCHYFDTDENIGYCIENSSNVIYAQPRLISAEDTVALMSDLIERYREINSIPESDYYAELPPGKDPFFEFVTEISPTLSSSAGTDGIFGTKIESMKSTTVEQRKQIPAAEFLLNTNEILDASGGFEPITSVEMAEELSENFVCVDPGFIFPCNGRNFRKEKNKYCKIDENDGSLTDCVCFCSHDTTDGTFNAAISVNLANDTVNGIRKGKNEGFYQTTGIGTKLEENSYKINPDNISEYYSVGPTRPGNGNINSSLDSAYIQNRVFCGGTRPRQTNNFDVAEDSKFPTPPLKGDGFFGF